MSLERDMLIVPEVFSLPSAAVVRAILDIGTLIFDDFTQIYWKLLTSSNVSPLILIES